MTIALSHHIRSGMTEGLVEDTDQAYEDAWAEQLPGPRRHLIVTAFVGENRAKSYRLRVFVTKRVEPTADAAKGIRAVQGWVIPSVAGRELVGRTYYASPQVLDFEEAFVEAQERG